MDDGDAAVVLLHGQHLQRSFAVLGSRHTVRKTYIDHIFNYFQDTKWTKRVTRVAIQYII